MPDEPIIRTRKPEIDVRLERQIIIGMVISDRFLKSLQPLLKTSEFQSGYASTVAKWCCDYWQRYKKSPGRDIEDIYLMKQRSIPEEQSELLEKFLSSLSDEYERGETFNADLLLDRAEQHFRLSALKNLRDKLNKAIVSGRHEEGESLVKSYERPALLQTNGIDPLRDMDFVVSSLVSDDENPDIIMQLPGALGQATGPLERGQLVAIQAESGIGKTWWLWMINRIALMRGFNTVFFSLEMSVKKMTRRIWQDMTGMVTRGDGLVRIPHFDCRFNQFGECTKPERKNKVPLIKEGKVPRIAPKNYLPCDACRDAWAKDELRVFFTEEKRDFLDAPGAVFKYEAMNRSGLIRKVGKSHLVEFPSHTITVREMVSYLENLEYYEGLLPDVIISDYADKFKWDVAGDPRNSIGRIWGEHKGLAQEKHCLVITASQSNTERSGKKVGKQSWSETVEKRRMLDLGIALNQSQGDYEDGICWVNVDKIRDGEKIGTAEIAVLQQLAIGRPYLDSCFVRAGKEGKK